MKAILTVILAVASVAGAVEPEKFVDQREKIFRLLAQLDQQQTLINGTVVDPAVHPTIIWINSGTSGCTATVVGPQAVLTAAHCNSGSITFGLLGERYSATCTYAKEYPRDRTADLSICKTDKKIEGVEYDSINLEPDHVKVGDWVMLTGYGCSAPGGGIDGKLRMGLSQVVKVFPGNNDFQVGNGAILCPGDSGGPAYSTNADASKNRVISANSRVDIGKGNDRISYIVGTASKVGQRFIPAAMAKLGVEICGVTEGLQGCRGSKPKEPSTFVIEHMGKNGKIAARTRAKIEADAPYSAELAQFGAQAVMDAAVKEEGK